MYEDSRFSIERPHTNKKLEYCIFNFSIFYIISFHSFRSKVSKLMWYGIGWYLKWSVISLDELYTVAYLKHAVLVLKHTVAGPLFSNRQPDRCNALPVWSSCYLLQTLQDHYLVSIVFLWDGRWFQYKHFGLISLYKTHFWVLSENSECHYDDS